ncbi:MAG: hypothetical protein WAQ52_05170 [Terriglobales bacterium]
MSAPETYVQWINQHLGFNPRSQANSNALCAFVIADLRQSCPTIASDLDANRVVPTTNADVRTRVASRNVDLVFLETGSTIARAAVENKTIMTAHGKARWNRYGDLIAYCNHVHNHRPSCIAAAIVIVNCSPAYENPDAFARGLLRPRFDMSKVVKDTVKIFADVPLRTSPNESNDQPEALAVIVVDYDGQHPAKLVTGELSPQPGSPIHYESFIAKICDLYRGRFGAARS